MAAAKPPEEHHGILETATTEKAIIDGNIYVVGEKPKAFIMSIRAGREVIYSHKKIKGVETLTYIIDAEKVKKPQTSAFKTGSQLMTEHTERSAADLKKENDAYNAKGEADAKAAAEKAGLSPGHQAALSGGQPPVRPDANALSAKDKMKKEMEEALAKKKAAAQPEMKKSFECAGCKRLLFEYPCPVCKYDPKKQATLTPPASPAAGSKPDAKKTAPATVTPAETQGNRFAGALDDQTAKEISRKPLKNDASYVMEAPLDMEMPPADEITSVTLGISLRFGAYNNVKVEVTGANPSATMAMYDYLLKAQSRSAFMQIKDISDAMGE